jgi:hypothetical protein
MKLRFRLGPFTFGKSGTRLSLWKGGTGVSIPLSTKGGKSFSKFKIGPVSAYFNGLFGIGSKKQQEQSINSNEELAIKALSTDEQLIDKLQNNGVPWRGIQECLKEALPESLENRNDIAFKLVPKAMNIVFGNQNTVWKTEKRPSKDGKGETTWIVLI